MVRQQPLRISHKILEKLSRDLARHYEHHCRGRAGETVVLILGAGASAASQVPSWDLQFRKEFLDRIARLFQPGMFVRDAWLQLEHEIGPARSYESPERLQERLVEEATLEQICSVACRYPGADALIRSLFVDFYTAEGRWTAADGPGSPPLLAYELIAHLVKHRFINHVVTFNFDELLDDALGNELGTRGFTRIVSGHESITVHKKRLPTLIKIHGTAGSPDTMRFSYLDVSVLTRAMREHLDALFAEPGRADARNLRLISIGYSWRDRSFANWVRAREELLHSLTVVRKESRSDERGRRRRLRPGLLVPLRHVKVISTDDLGGASVENFCWVFTENTLAKVGRRFPIQPESRHLLISKLFGGLWGTDAGMVDATEVLRKRAQVEVVLHLAKAKGMVNTASAPDLPRLRAYLGRLQGTAKITAADFLEELGLSEVMKRSSEPEAWDTYFATAQSLEDFRRDLVGILVAGFPADHVDVPRCTAEGRVEVEPHRATSFFEKQIGKILSSSEVEVLSAPEHQDRWSFVSPASLVSYGRFGCRIAEVVRSDWTYLLAITESLRWTRYPWLEDHLVRAPKKGSILAILPSHEGIQEWRFRHEFLSDDLKPSSRYAVARIPWWQHNRHMIVALSHREGKLVMKGVYFGRPFRSTGISPIALDDLRDCVKLLGIFFRYCSRLDWSDVPPEFDRSLTKLVKLVTRKPPLGGLNAELEDFIQVLSSRMRGKREASRRARPREGAIKTGHPDRPNGGERVVAPFAAVPRATRRLPR